MIVHVILLVFIETQKLLGNVQSPHIFLRVALGRFLNLVELIYVLFSLNELLCGETCACTNN